MSRNYYCLIAGLPELQPDQNKKVFSLSEFKQELEEQLHPSDAELVRLLFLPYDNENLLQLLQKKDIDAQLPANYLAAELKEEINEPGNLDAYFGDFITEYLSDETVSETKNVIMEQKLTEAFYNYVIGCKNLFLSDWFRFDLTLKNIMTALNCKKHDIKVEQQLIGNDELVQTMAKSSSKDLGIAVEVPEIERIAHIFESPKLLDREKLLDRFRWDWLNEHTTFNYFSVEVVLSYVIKLTIVDRWSRLDPQTGTEMFDRLLNDIESSYQFPKEFNINEGKR